ncbi:MAG: hypothetical protein A2Z81_07050 [Omnitrophica WOR_2 bacterium GWA2_45_18]|nr:MAG: hypothetical protein A2Z81_07050 [Omnitrophica WOR_2 bacterium GWA2_45_18]
MNEEQILQHKKNMMAIGRLLWEKGLVSGLNGNISVRANDAALLITAHASCLGLLQEKDILAVSVEGSSPADEHASTEKFLHAEIYKHCPHVKAVIHTHTVYTNAYFLENETFASRIFEARFHLGDVQSVAQTTPSVTNAEPVIERLKENNVVVLRQHGVVAVGHDLFDCFILIQALEEAIKTDAISRLYARERMTSEQPRLQTARGEPVGPPETGESARKFKLFSQEQIEEIVRVVNADAQMAELGEKTRMTMDLAVQLNETGQVHSFSFQNGRIAGVGHDADAEFLISAPEGVWRAVFKRQIDPFVATTQKKMHLRGDFAKISKWYAPCSRIFELWQRVPVE